MAIKEMPRPTAARLRAHKRRREAEQEASENPELIKCRNSVDYFIDNYCIIDDTQKLGGNSGQMPFRLWEAQRETLQEIQDNPKTIILKARQLGISWLVCAYVLWYLLFNSGQLALMFSKTEDDSKELIRRITVMYQRLPGWFQEACPVIRKPSVTSVHWKNGSRVKADAATPTAGSGEAASILVLDEAAKMQWARKLYTAAAPTIDNGTTKLIVLSTAFGIGNLFHDLWMNAVDKLNDFKEIFLPWWSRPGRDQAWYDAKVRNAADPEEIAQEYPDTALSAFLSTGRFRFPNSWVAKQSVNLRNPIDPSLLPDPLRFIKKGLSVYELPEFREPHHPPTRPGGNGRPVRLVISGDVAEGKENGDFSGGPLVDIDTLEEIANLHGHWEPDEYAELLAIVADAYDAKILVERNNHGHAVLSKLRTLCPHRILVGHDEDQGWHTNILTKPISVDALAVGLRDVAVTVRTKRAAQEMGVYSVLADGKTSAPAGQFDDLVIAWANLMGWRQMVGWKTSGPAFLGGPSRQLMNPTYPQSPAGRLPNGTPQMPPRPAPPSQPVHGTPGGYGVQPGQPGQPAPQSPIGRPRQFLPGGSQWASRVPVPGPPKPRGMR